MQHIFLGILVLVCLGLSAAAGGEHFARKAYANGCKHQAADVLDRLMPDSPPDLVDQIKQIMYDRCDAASQEASLKEIL